MMTTREWKAIARDRLRPFLGGPPDGEFLDELAAHLMQAYEEARRDGAPEADAKTAALALLRDSSPWIEAARERGRPRARGGLMQELGFWRDVRHALRMLVRTPAFSLIAIFTFAVGIGANTAVFSVVNGVLLRPLPYPDSDRITLVWVDNRREKIKEDITSYPNYRDWRDQNSSYAMLAGYSDAAFALTGAGEPERLMGAETTANFFDVMGVKPMIGRVYGVENETPGKDAVAVISYGLWQRRFGGTPDVLGKTITLNTQPYELIGVMPPELRWPETAEHLGPAGAGRAAARVTRIVLDAGDRTAEAGRLRSGRADRHGGHFHAARKGVSGQQRLRRKRGRPAGSDRRPRGSRPQGIDGRGRLRPPDRVRESRQSDAGEDGGAPPRAGDSHGARRRPRTPDPPDRHRVARARIHRRRRRRGSRGVGDEVVRGGGRRHDADEGRIGLDARVLLFAFGIATLAALMAGLLPALHASRAAVANALREGGRQGGPTVSRRTRNVLVGAEVALALVLLTGAGLLLRTLWGMQHVERGFRAERDRHGDGQSARVRRTERPDAVRAFYGRFLERVRAVPGVESAALTSGILIPLLANSGTFAFEGKPLPPPDQRLEYPVEAVSPKFFETIGARMAAGRVHRPGSRERTARRDRQRDTGRRRSGPVRIRSEAPEARRRHQQSPWFTVVGVVRDLRRADVRDSIRGEIYRCTLQTIAAHADVACLAPPPSRAAVMSTIRRELQASIRSCRCFA